MDKIILTSTHVDAHNTRMALSALQGMVEQINGTKKVRWGLEHDMSMPPLGRIDDAEIIQGQDGEYYLLAALVPYDNSYSVELPDGTILRKETFNQPIIFVDNTEDNIENIVVSFDPVNVGGENSLTELYEDIRNETKLFFQKRSIFRKSLIPDPEVVVQIANHFVDALFAYKIVEKAIDKFQEKLAEDFYDLIKVTAKKAMRKLIPFDKQITYIFKGTYNGVAFELLTQTRSDVTLLACIDPEKLRTVAGLLELCKNTLQAVKVQLMYNTDISAWELNYLIDIEGSVIGDKKSFDRQKAVMTNMVLSYPTSN